MKWKYYKPKFEFDSKTPSTWWGHTFFAYDLIRNVKPKRVVELGTHYGASFFAMCQAVKDDSFGTEMHAVDSWEGDAHARAGYEKKDEVFNVFKKEVKASYSKIDVKLHRKFFDEALKEFDSSSIDILHIDGLHTYEAVKHDFESWLPKVREDGLILFHDIHEKKDDFGVYKLWNELKERYDTIEFYHWHGLGVLFMKDGSRDIFFNNQDEIKGYYANRADRFAFNMLKIEKKIHKKRNTQIQRTNQEIKQKNQEIKQKNHQLQIIKQSKFWKIRNHYVAYKNKMFKA